MNQDADAYYGDEHVDSEDLDLSFLDDEESTDKNPAK